MATVAELREMERAAFRAPWTAHTFEIDCPCPNGEHCGDSHTCEEVEAPTEYPDSPEEPAEVGQGQCIVQISIPGLESFTRPNGALIVAMRNHFAALLDVAEAADAVMGEFGQNWSGNGSIRALRASLARLAGGG